ncbi:unnamed protein product [Mesocestoides corti]|uniref:MKRN2 opposite strand protein n=1 Tax=Mesocestoides corti TaxID=53468 RepID=A0A0R3UE76_MESCO|nr:unnamed protein product [Mesocestoides corti]
MLQPLYRYRTKCCSNADSWQYALASRTLNCQFCGSVAEFASLPHEVPPPVQDAHVPVSPGACPVRVAFIASNREIGFLNFAIGDELHCGVVDTEGCVTSYSPKEKRFYRERSRTWKQSIICVPPEAQRVEGEFWDRKIHEGIRNGPVGPQFDCLDFVVSVLNLTLGTDAFSREKLSELMCRQLYHVLKYSELQRLAIRNKMI